MRIALIYNPMASKRTATRVDALARVLTARGHAISRHDSLAFRQAVDAPDAELLCICGGDGTARLVLDTQEDLSALPVVAIYPIGTINLLARELGYPARAEAFARRIERNAPPRNCLTARIGGKLFLACASVGVDAQAVAKVSLSLKAWLGRFAYLESLAGMLLRWPRHRLRITGDGEEMDAEAVFVLRGAFYAGPWTLDRGAGLDQGKLHVLALPRARRRDMLRLALYALTGARHPHPDWRFMQVSQLQVRADEGLPVQADGDIVAATPVSMCVSKQSVTWK